nr:MAG TPA: hypothetical protein [Caudoviricetes sp.]
MVPDFGTVGTAPFLNARGMAVSATFRAAVANVSVLLVCP